MMTMMMMMLLLLFLCLQPRSVSVKKIKRRRETHSFSKFRLANTFLATSCGTFRSFRLLKSSGPCGVFSILTSKRASRHSGVQTFHMSEVWLPNFFRLCINCVTLQCITMHCVAWLFDIFCVLSAFLSLSRLHVQLESRNAELRSEAGDIWFSDVSGTYIFIWSVLQYWKPISKMYIMYNLLFYMHTCIHELSMKWERERDHFGHNVFSVISFRLLRSAVG